MKDKTKIGTTVYVFLIIISLAMFILSLQSVKNIIKLNNYTDKDNLSYIPCTDFYNKVDSSCYIAYNLNSSELKNFTNEWGTIYRNCMKYKFNNSY